MVIPLLWKTVSPDKPGFLRGVYVYNNYVYRQEFATCLSGGLTNRTEDIQMREAFNRVVRISAAIIAGLFVLAAIAEGVRSAYAPFNGFAANAKWVPGLRNFLYLMTMFNILLIRYVIMRIYIASGHINTATIVTRLFKADVASMLISELPCLYGLVLFLMAGDLIDFYLLFGFSVIYSTIYFPRYKKWVSIMEEKEESGSSNS